MCSLAVILVAASQTDWRFYGHDAGGMRYSPLSQITRGNVSRLGRAWTFHTGDLPAASGPRGQRRVAFETTPLAINGVLYLSTPASRIIALDGDSGRQIWKFESRRRVLAG
jgi:quinoprotein glucose dehydrogenase